VTARNTGSQILINGHALSTVLPSSLRSCRPGSRGSGWRRGRGGGAAGRGGGRSEARQERTWTATIMILPARSIRSDGDGYHGRECDSCGTKAALDPPIAVALRSVGTRQQSRRTGQIGRPIHRGDTVVVSCMPECEKRVPTRPTPE